MCSMHIMLPYILEVSQSGVVEPLGKAGYEFVISHDWMVLLAVSGAVRRWFPAFHDGQSRCSCDLCNDMTGENSLM